MTLLLPPAPLSKTSQNILKNKKIGTPLPGGNLTSGRHNLKADKRVVCPETIGDNKECNGRQEDDDINAETRDTGGSPNMHILKHLKYVTSHSIEARLLLHQS
jgi:hypothetical protein